jgi:hypothetical protein
MFTRIVGGWLLLLAAAGSLAAEVPPRKEKDLRSRAALIVTGTKKNSSVRLFLARNKDGTYDILYPNGFQILKKQESAVTASVDEMNGQAAAVPNITPEHGTAERRLSCGSSFSASWRASRTSADSVPRAGRRGAPIL